MKLEFDYIRKNKSLIFLKKEYLKSVIDGKHGKGIDILFDKICQLNNEINQINMSIPTRTSPIGNYKIIKWH